MYLTHPIHDLPPELKLMIIDHVSDLPSLKALFQSRLWHRRCGVYIQKQVFENITLALSQASSNRKQAIPTEAVLSSLERTSRLRTYVWTLSVQGDVSSKLSGDTMMNVSRLAALIPDMSHLGLVSLNDIRASGSSHSVLNALTSCVSLRFVAFEACSFSLQDIANLLHSAHSLEILHFGLVSVNGLALHDDLEEIDKYPLIDFGDALQNGVSRENREQGVSLKELKFTALDGDGIDECSALHLWDFLATSGVLREVGILDATALDLYTITPDRLQTMVNLTRWHFTVNSKTFRLGDVRALKDKEPIQPVLQLNNISGYQFSISTNINRPHEAYGVDEKLLLWNIQVLNTSHQLERLVIHFALNSVYPPPTDSDDSQTWAEVDKAVSITARELQVLLLVFHGNLASDHVEDVRKGLTAWILKRIPRATTKFGLEEEPGWRWNQGRRGCLTFLLSSDSNV
ncbi:hypothetical protein BDZ89DRAFT_1160554 [Hymenopellis radicata]|nr:hypothetical protein BDZ89DRAFT_1160554 [Hymenopellis radicata]